MIEIKNIQMNYGKKQVLKDISFEAAEGKIIGILGANGAGKSTLFSILAGLVSPKKGSFLLDGQDMQKSSLRNKMVAYVPQDMPLIEELSAWDNLRMWYSKKDLKGSCENGFLKTLGVDEFINVRVKNMSGGMKKRLSIGCAINSNPQVLLLDEPTAALDLVCKKRIYDYLKEYATSGAHILIATHDVQEIKLCDECYIIRDGSCLAYNFDGDVDELTRRLCDEC